jgi:hypothetical protein
VSPASLPASLPTASLPNFKRATAVFPGFGVAATHVATQVPTSLETVRGVHCQHERERDQCPYTLHLFQPLYLRVVLLDQLIELPVVGRDALGECLDFRQQRQHRSPDLWAQLGRLRALTNARRARITARSACASAPR